MKQIDNITILIIDDDAAISEVLTLVLENEGYKIVTDLRGDYFDKFPKVLPDLVLLDLLLPGRNGKDICNAIKQDPRTRHIPVILISANTPKEVENVKNQTGAESFVTKPFDIHNLLDEVKKFT